MSAANLTLPNARPTPFHFPSERTALILIDMQRDFVKQGGFGWIQCGNPEVFARVGPIIPNVQRLLAHFRQLNGHVIHTREGHQPDLADLPMAKRLRQTGTPPANLPPGVGDQGPMGRLLVRGEYGHDIIDELTPWPGETILDKPGKGSFWGTDFHRVLLAKGVTHLIFAGVTTECCVTTTLRECNDRGYQCCVLEDCTAGFDAKQVNTSLDIICAHGGLFGYVGTSVDLLPQIDNGHACSVPTTTASSLLANGQLPPMDELISHYKNKHFEPKDIVNLVFDRIKDTSAENPAVWTHLEAREKCVETAEWLTTLYRGKPLPPLFGVPFSVKDTIDVAYVKTTAACPQCAYVADTSAPGVQHVLDAGAIFIGKVNLDQLATGLSGCCSPYGTPHSVFSKEHISGGSSSGSAVSVGLGLVSFGLATDMAGGGQVPSAYNCIAGFKPTKGTVSARGLVPACRTLDTITVMAPSVTEVRKVWQIIARHDSEDPFSKIPSSLATWAIDFRGPGVSGFFFATPPISALQVCHPEYTAMFHSAVKKIQDCGEHVSHKEVDYSIFKRAGDLLYDTSLQHERVSCIGLEFLQANMQYLHPVIRQFFSGAFESRPSLYDVFRDQNLQTQLTRKVQQMFDPLQQGIDVLIVPTTTEHPRIEEMMAEPLKINSRLGTFTRFANVVDMCGVNIPAGTYVDKKDRIKLPFGITILGGSGFDAKVLSIAKVIEKALLEDVHN